MGEDLEEVIEKEQDFWNKHLGEALRETFKEVRKKPINKLHVVSRREQEFITDVKRVAIQFPSLAETYVWLYNQSIGIYLREHGCEPYDFLDEDKDED